jgi:hypothetical protein
MSDTPMDNAYWRHPAPDTSPQAIWALLREVAEGKKETDLQMKKDAEEWRERQKETDRQMKEFRLQQQETARQIKEARLQQQKDAEERRERQKEIDRQMQETAREMKETNRRFGDLGNRFGELAEHLVVPNIEEKFNALGFAFEKVALNQRLIDPSGKRYAEIDIILEGDNTVIAVEVKSKPRKEDIDIHISRIEALREKTDPRISKRYIGAVAGAIMIDEVREYIHQNGLYAIEQTGDTVKISNGEGFIPRQW